MYIYTIIFEVGHYGVYYYLHWIGDQIQNVIDVNKEESEKITKSLGPPLYKYYRNKRMIFHQPQS